MTRVGWAPLRLGERAEELGEGVRLYVPDEPRIQMPPQWDRNNWLLDLAGN